MSKKQSLERDIGIISMKVKCPRCGYQWETKSQLVYVNCPSCRTSVKIRDVKK